MSGIFPLGPPPQLGIIATAAKLLFIDGQTTQATLRATERLARALGVNVTLIQHWGELILVDEHTLDVRFIPAAPTGIDMGRVAATERAVDAICEGRCEPAAALASLEAVERTPPLSTPRLAIMAGAGAAALGVIFGAPNLLTLVLIAISAGLGGCIRKLVGRLSTNPLAQPFFPALLAGLVTSLASLAQLDVAERLVAVCPCMVLVPGPHILNGTIDLARHRIPLGACRILLASLIILLISSGLLVGLLPLGTLPVSGELRPVPLGYDVIAAGIAVSAYGSFFNMAWKVIPIPMVVGMLAHAARWQLLASGATVQTADFAACLLVGIIIAPIADRLRLPFAALAFASVVSLIPGVYLFQLAAELTALIGPQQADSHTMVVAVLNDGTTAFVITLAIAVGVIMPRMMADWIRVGARSTPS